MMTNTFLYICWGVLYAICAILGFFNLPGWVGLPVSLLFFLPPALLLYRAHKTGDRAAIRRIRNISIVWLSTALLLLILNIASAAMSLLAGNILYYGLILLTSPMVCSGFWLLPMFLWACLLMTAIQLLRKK